MSNTKPPKTSKNNWWFERSADGGILCGVCCIILWILGSVAVVVGLAIVGRIGIYIFPGAIAWQEVKCYDIFTHDATFFSWMCHLMTGIYYLVAGCIAIAFINLMLWPYHVWHRNNPGAIVLFVLCLIPFYVF